MENLECLKAAVGYMAERKFDVISSFSFSFQIADPGDEVNDGAIADAVYLETGIRTEWFPHRVGDMENPVTTELPPVATKLPVTTELPPVAT